MPEAAVATTPVDTTPAPVETPAPSAAESTPAPAESTPAPATVLTGTESTSGDGATDTSGDGATDTNADDSSQNIVPETYADFKLPEGVALDEAALGTATPLFKELGLTQEQSQKVVDLYATQVQAGNKAQVEAFNQLTSGWAEQSSNDKEFGGDKFEENLGIARSALDKFGTPELKELMESHGVGNHPEMVRFMIKVGQTVKADNPDGGANKVSPEQSRVNILYPKKS